MKPTDSQLGVLYRWFSWKMSTPKASNAIKWLENNADRGAVSKEIQRVGDLYRNRQLNEKLCFDSEIWADYLAKGTKV